MIQVRDVFRIKFGKIDQAVELFGRLHEVVPQWPQLAGQYEILTDLSGDMYSLVTCLHVNSVAAWESLSAEMWKLSGFQEWFRSFQLFVADGQRRFYTVEQANSGWSRGGAVIVRSTFRCLEWRVADTVDLLKSHGAMLADRKVGDRPRILTDFSGPMYNVILEVETPDLKVWDDHRRNMFADPQFQVWFTKMVTCVARGEHEFLRVAS